MSNTQTLEEQSDEKHVAFCKMLHGSYGACLSRVWIAGANPRFIYELECQTGAIFLFARKTKLSTVEKYAESEQ